MASNKNQHFVPKVCLRPFSCDEDRASINLFNLKRRESISGCSIRGQCSSDYFYGDSKTLDKALQGSEDRYGTFLKELDDRDFCLEERHKELLRHFCLLQYCRTEAQVQRSLQFVMGMTNAAFDGSPPPEYVPNAKETAQIAMKTFAESMNVVYDLKVRVVRNRTALDFITSDNPSVHTNRWHQQSPKARGKAPGISSAGVIFFMPLTPLHLCVAYDGDVYTIDHKDDWVDVDSVDDVACLNEHQYLNCQANVYFADWSSRQAVGQAFDSVAQRRPAKRHEVTVAVLESEDAWGQKFRVVPLDQIKGHTQGMVHVKEILPVPSRWPRFLKMRNKPRIYSNNSGTGFVRAWSLRRGAYSGTGYRKLK